MDNSSQRYELQHSLSIDPVLMKIMLPFSIHKTAHFHQKQPPETVKIFKTDATGAATWFPIKKTCRVDQKNMYQLGKDFIIPSNEFECVSATIF